jgi:tetratricopeptide (TPR) repeat protein
MTSRLPRWLLITLVSVALLVLIGVLWWLINAGGTQRIVGWVLLGLLLVALIVIASVVAPPLVRLYRFSKYFKKHEDQLRLLPTLLQSGRIQEALIRFEGVMKHAPENAYLYYMRANFLQAAGKLPEALAAANKAMTLVTRDPFLAMILQQMGGQMGQPTTVDEFKEQLELLRRSLEPRVFQMRERRDKAVTKRKKKSR